MKRVCISLLLVVSAIILYYFYPVKPLPAEPKITKLVVIKSEKILKVYSGETLLKTYSVAIGKSPEGKKEFQGDNKTPEGTYTINDKNPYSRFHKNLGISYPNKIDIASAKKRGLTPGGEIKIHGLKNGLGFIGKFHRLRDWTTGCIALTNEEIDELYDRVPLSTPIVILP